MGAGGSALPTDSNINRYFCHQCRRIFAMSIQQSAVGVHMHCPYCHSGFLEEFGPSTNRLSARDLRLGLTDEQTRRLNNAATLLQILEAQLREELDHLQSAFLAAEARKPAPLSKKLLDSLKNKNITVDMICDQPCCPICSEDYILGEIATQLPCTHIYHKACVMPWLEQKRTCPICRFELKDSIPSLEELIRLSRPELVERLDHIHITEGLDNKNDIQLAQLLHTELVRQSELEEAADLAAAEQDEWRQALEEERVMDQLILAQRRDAAALAEAAEELEAQTLSQLTGETNIYNGTPNRSSFNGLIGTRSSQMVQGVDADDGSDLEEEMTEEEVRTLIFQQAGFGNPSGYTPPSATRLSSSSASLMSQQQQLALQTMTYVTSNRDATAPLTPHRSLSIGLGTSQASRSLIVPTSAATDIGSGGSGSGSFGLASDSHPFIRPQFSSNRRMSASGESLTSRITDDLD